MTYQIDIPAAPHADYAALAVEAWTNGKIRAYIHAAMYTDGWDYTVERLHADGWRAVGLHEPEHINVDMMDLAEARKAAIHAIDTTPQR